MFRLLRRRLRDLDSQNPPIRNVEAYSLRKLGRGQVEITVTKGTYAGRSAVVLTSDPTHAYFNLP